MLQINHLLITNNIIFIIHIRYNKKGGKGELFESTSYL